MGLFDGTPLERPVLCERCGEDVKQCRCPPATPQEVPPEQQRLGLRSEKRKRGKVVTVVTGFNGPPQQLKRLLAELKNHCGAGGTTQEELIEIQGDHVARLRQWLLENGYRVE